MLPLESVRRPSCLASGGAKLGASLRIYGIRGAKYWLPVRPVLLRAPEKRQGLAIIVGPARNTGTTCPLMNGLPILEPTTCVFHFFIFVPYSPAQLV